MVKAEIESVIKKYIHILNDTGLDIKQAYIYGSCARGDNSAESDIDVMLISDIFDTDDDSVLSRPWIYTVKVDPRIEPVAVGSSRFKNDTGSPLIEIVKKEGIKIM
jgi:predicted nucleotidyltransferase